MENYTDSITEIKKYLNKLKMAVNSQALFFNMGNWHLVKKNKIDDLICCIEANIPQKIRANINKINKIDLGSIETFKHLKNILTKKFILNNNLYSINSNITNSYIQHIINNIENDIKHIENLL